MENSLPVDIVSTEEVEIVSTEEVEKSKDETVDKEENDSEQAQATNNQSETEEDEQAEIDALLNELKKWLPGDFEGEDREADIINTATVMLSKLTMMALYCHAHPELLKR